MGSCWTDRDADFFVPMPRLTPPDDTVGNDVPRETIHTVCTPNLRNGELTLAHFFAHAN